jgi:hypothetical protein
MFLTSHLLPLTLALTLSRVSPASGQTAQPEGNPPAYNSGGGGSDERRVSTAWLGFGLTNLSPEIHYTPPLVPGHNDPLTGWVVTRNSSFTRMPEASVSWQYWGEGSHAYGHSSHAEEDVQNDAGVEKVAPNGVERWGFPQGQYASTAHSTLWRTRMNLEGTPLGAWNITLSTPDEAIWAGINLSRVDLMTQLPSREYV